MKLLIGNILTCCMIALIWWGVIHLWQMHEDMVMWSETPVVYGPVDWKEKEKDCIRRATLVGGYVDYVDDDRYCTVGLENNESNTYKKEKYVTDNANPKLPQKRKKFDPVGRP